MLKVTEVGQQLTYSKDKSYEDEDIQVEVGDGYSSFSLYFLQVLILMVTHGISWIMVKI